MVNATLQLKSLPIPVLSYPLFKASAALCLIAKSEMSEHGEYVVQNETRQHCDVIVIMERISANVAWCVRKKQKTG